MTANTTANIKPTTNKIQAICVAVPAIPVKPKTAAIRPTIKNVIAQLNIIIPSIGNLILNLVFNSVTAEAMPIQEN